MRLLVLSSQAVTEVGLLRKNVEIPGGIPRHLKFKLCFSFDYTESNPSDKIIS